MRKAIAQDIKTKFLNSTERIIIQPGYGIKGSKP